MTKIKLLRWILKVKSQKIKQLFFSGLKPARIHTQTTIFGRMPTILTLVDFLTIGKHDFRIRQMFLCEIFKQKYFQALCLQRSSLGVEWSEGSILLPCVYKVFRISILSILALSMLHDSKFCFHASMEYLMFSLILSSFSQWPHIILTPREQPDLNYWNPLIVQEMRDILQFWTDRRVSLYKIGHFHRTIYFLIVNVVIKTLSGVLMASAWTPCLSSSRISSSGMSHCREKQK